MAADNLKDFTVNWVLFGFLFFCLMSFALTFMFYNNPSYGLGDAEAQFESSHDGISSQLSELPEDSDLLLNISSKTNPEASFLGSRDSIATSYGLTGTGLGFLTQSKVFIGWIFSGPTGILLIEIIGGLFGLVSIYYITKWIRTGF